MRRPLAVHETLLVRVARGVLYCVFFVAALRQLSANDLSPSFRDQLPSCIMDGADAVVEPKKNLQVRTLPLKGRLFVDKTGPHSWQLTDVVTHERRTFDSEVELIFEDDDGDHAVVATGIDGTSEPTVCLPEQFMKRNVGMTETGERLLLVSTPSGIHHQSLDILMAKYVAARLQLEAGSLGASVPLDCYIMKRPRAAGMSVFWDARQLYGILKMTSYNNVASKWVGMSYPRWEKALGRQFPGRHILHSKHANHGDRVLASVSWWDRSLPSLSISSLALFSILSSWAFASKLKNGLG